MHGGRANSINREQLYAKKGGGKSEAQKKHQQPPMERKAAAAEASFFCVLMKTISCFFWFSIFRRQLSAAFVTSHSLSCDS
jgi:hypothetical protein